MRIKFILIICCLLIVILNSCVKETEVLPPYIGGTYLCNEISYGQTYVAPNSYIYSTKDTSYLLTIEYSNRSTNSIYFQDNYCTLDKSNTYKWYYRSNGGYTSDTLHFEERNIFYRRSATTGASAYLTTITGKRIN